MLNSISGAVGNEKVYLFMDNAGFYKNEEVRNRMRELNIEPVYNVAY